jgi:predicted CXXCH cytochrome family protein
MPVRKLNILVILIVAFLCKISYASTLTLNYPFDRVVMDLELLSISLKVQKDAVSFIKVYVNNVEAKQIVPDLEYECFTVNLFPGKNRIHIVAEKDGIVNDTIVFEVFRRSNLLSEYSKAPYGFNKDYFHMRKNTECRNCHTLDPSDSDVRPINITTFRTEVHEDEISASRSTSTCYSCHKAITSYPYVHGPASVWSCLTCHNPDARPVYAVKKPDTEICFQCHTEQKQDWSSKKIIHGPVNTGNCAICHSPHSAQNPFNLVKPTWDLCVSCHEGKGTGRHIIAGYVYGSSHPTRDKPDPLRKGKEMSCASCHNPHASDYPKLWALNAKSAFILCQKCHKK